MPKIFFILLSILSSCALAQTKLPVTFTISGLSGDALDNAKKTLEQVIARREPPRTKAEADYLAEQGNQAIQLALHPYGYFSPTLHYTLHYSQEQWQIDYQITVGNPVRLRKVNLRITGAGASEPELQRAIAQSPLRSGDIFNSMVYEDTKKHLFSQAEHLGYLTVQFLHSHVLINPQQHYADIDVLLATGPRYYFGTTQFSGGNLSDEFLQRFLPFQAGQPYNSDQLLELEQRLTNSGYFAQVEVIGEPEQAVHHQVPITVRLASLPAKRYRLGIGFGTDTGPRATLGFDWRRVNLSGHRFNSTLKLSELQAILQARYEIPGQDPLRERYAISAQSSQESKSKGNSISHELSLSTVKLINQWERTFSLTYQIERFRKDQHTPYRNARLLLPSLSWTNTQVDNALDPSTGYQLRFMVKGATKALVSSVSFLQFFAEGDYYHPVTWGRIRARARLGYSLVAEQDNLPLTHRFYAGGAQSVRGYHYQELGPGRYLTEFSIQYQQQLHDQWYVGPFIDLGNASNQNFGRSLKKGIGLVLTWVSPIGPLNLSIGQAISKEGNPILVQFSMGSGL